ncbi:MAG TPA: hypothetical protein VFS62_06015, partial [Chloroflexota bacterium]|nr:hypothetical protein [Chloroflexota bacterium]
MANRYQVSGELEYGSLGRVLRAHDQRLNRDVAILELDGPPTHDLLAGAELAHPNIVRVYDAGPNFLVLELVEGHGHWTPTSGSHTAHSQLSAALAYAHERGYAHGRLSPDSILMTAGGQPKLLGVGAWHAADAAAMQADLRALDGLLGSDAGWPSERGATMRIAPAIEATQRMPRLGAMAAGASGAAVLGSAAAGVQPQKRSAAAAGEATGGAPAPAAGEATGGAPAPAAGDATGGAPAPAAGDAI